MIAIADIVAEQRNRIYNLGGMITLRSYKHHMPYDYVIKIDAVKTDIIDETKYIINFTMSFDIPENKLKQIFDYVETDKGTIIDEFTFIDEGAVQVKIPVGEKISMIVVKSPDYKDCVRKVSVE